MRATLRSVVHPARPAGIAVVTDPVERRALILELVIVGALTFAFSAISAALSLVEAQLAGGIGNTTVALNPSRSDLGWIDFARQLMSALRLFAIGGLGVYLLWRSGFLRLAGLDRGPTRRDLPAGVGLAAVVGLPGLALVAIARALGVNAHLVPSEVDGVWWRWPILILLAVGNAAAEEIIVVAYFITRLRQLGASENASLAASSVLRGGYHLYQGVGAGLGNVVMGLVFGRFFQVTSRVWPLVVAHAVMDIVAFVGYALLHDHLSWVG
ncbi:CPBP family intramembrane glutamic endopeptidase [Gordonia sp. Z-3]|jgi:membrane protease YdiL (CAAX protease family)|uniref:CPBP family intramembrane metalloprotease n=2 Tax=Gordonia TaxID=2053 RepID=A0A9X3DAU8_9ACTN|nr:MULTISPECIES: CPBP family intramembrane glutamic endopeptidase [Gordonia]MCF3940876.1 CPBP family intramembrane metalloprotease [Gordonia tangerina]MCX2966901.1 CPBP family intramembrane metalloprotease [Gordonia aquimaris]MED5803963.1 CPBP family intramembrane glutamic endopeptidase [Gordonia sp. Z-3]